MSPPGYGRRSSRPGPGWPVIVGTARSTGWRHVLLSRRQLHTLFTRELGIGPKAVNRLMRFQHAVRAIAATVPAGTRADLGRVAAECGYFDQSHLTRDFRQFTGTSPTGWLAEERRNIQAGSRRNGDD